MGFPHTGHALKLVGESASMPGPGQYKQESHDHVVCASLSHKGHDLDLVQSRTVPGPAAYAHTSPRHVAGGSFSRTGHALDLVGSRGSNPGPGLYGAEGHHHHVTGGCLSHTGHN